MDILESLFSKIVIPKFIIDYEMLKNGKQQRFQILQHKRSNPSSPFEVIDKDQNKTFKRIVSYEYAEMIKYIDPGEAECCGYAKALSIKIIISDNRRDFDEMEKRSFILLGHRELLTLSVLFSLLTVEDAASIYNQINHEREWLEYIIGF
ncbi:hypothetical protein KHA80_11820 [Anaerobacillus sp. HL2]|nr:hypothetical protein KHA80_11820 [Anaerobacillus sp. HL2]